MGAAVASRVIGKVAVACLVSVATTGDDVDRGAPTGELIKGGELSGRHRWRHKTRPMREQKLEPAGDGSGVRADQKAVGGHGKITDEHTVKSRCFVNAGRLSNHVQIKGGAGWGNQLG